MPKFDKSERLKSEKIIGRLFKEGKSYMAYPIRVVWMDVPPHKPDTPPVQIAFSVPKRAFKTAVARNRIKRQMREAWRLQKEFFYERLQPAERHIALMAVFIAKESLPFSEIEGGVRKMIRKFA